MSFWLVQNADIFILSRFVSHTELGIYSLASLFQQVVTIPMRAYLDARFAEMTRGSSDPAGLRAMRRRMRVHPDALVHGTCFTAGGLDLRIAQRLRPSLTNAPRGEDFDEVGATRGHVADPRAYLLRRSRGVAERAE